ncbi:hypothetical protein ACPXCE_05290 [Streptomyces sp. DT24]|uniref:hypothetical protein n=1 Tax=Streptomyces sp. DT24 TaxID=3416520 RepID=UPI003CFACB3C
MILTRGARVTGAVLCGVLAVLTGAWVARDLGAADGPGGLWRSWSGDYAAQPTFVPTTSSLDVVLLVAYLVVALTAWRSPVAASALVGAGALTLVVRLPGLWTIGASWAEDRATDQLRTRALGCACVALAIGAALVVTVLAGRRAPRDAYEPLPTRAGPGASAVAYPLLGLAGAVGIAWEIRQATLTPEAYPDWLIGGRRVHQPLIDAPAGWTGVTIALLCLVAAVSGLVRAGHARPLALFASGLVLNAGLLGITRIVRYDLLDHFSDFRTEAQLTVATWLFEAGAGVVVLLVTAAGGTRGRPSEPYAGYGAWQGYGPDRAPGPWQGHGTGGGPARAPYPPGYAPGQPPGHAPGYPPAHGYPPGTGSAPGPDPGRWGYGGEPPSGDGGDGRPGGFGPPPPPSEPPPGR